MAGREGALGASTASKQSGGSDGLAGSMATSRGLKALLEARRRLQTEEARRVLSFMMVCCTVGVDFTGVTMQAPLIPFYVEEFHDAREMGSGTANALLITSYSLSQLVATPLFGLASDRFGRRPLFLLSLLGGALGFLAQGFATSLWSLCALRFFSGLFGGSRPVALAYIGDTVSPEQQPKYMAGIATTVSVSLFVAPVFGGSMGLISLQLPCFFQAGLGLLTLLMAYRYLEEPLRSDSSVRHAASGAAPAAPSRRMWKLPLAANALVGSLAMGVISSWQTLLPILGSEDLGLNQNEIGLMMGMSGFMVALAQFAIFVPLSRRVRLPLLGCAGMALISAPSLTWVGESVFHVVALSALHAMGAGLVLSGLSIVVNLLSPPALRGTIMALTVTAQAASRVIFPLLTGPMYDVQKWSPMVLMGCAGLLGVALEFALSWSVQKLPRPGDRRPPQPSDDKPPSSDVESGAAASGQDERGELEEERQLILESLREVHSELDANLRVWRGRLRDLHAGKTAEELSIPTEHSHFPKIEDDQKEELGRWLSDMLVERNYQRWPQHMDTLKCTLKNAFPQVRMTPTTTRCEDFIHMLESHVLLSQRWERFILARPQAWQEYMQSDMGVIGQLTSRV